MIIKSEYIIVLLVTDSCILFFKLFNAQKAFDKYFIESSKPMYIYECINKKCFTNNFTNSLVAVYL